MKSTRFIVQSPSYSPVNIPYLPSKDWKENEIESYEQRS
jgi:hypothetical protein